MPKPTKPGFYWWYGYGYPEVVKVVNSSLVQTFHPHDLFTVAESDEQFWGPEIIPPGEEP